MESIVALLVALILLGLCLKVAAGCLRPSRLWSRVLAGWIQDSVRALWHVLFGHPKVRIKTAHGSRSHLPRARRHRDRRNRGYDHRRF